MKVTGFKKKISLLAALSCFTAFNNSAAAINNAAPVQTPTPVSHSFANAVFHNALLHKTGDVLHRFSEDAKDIWAGFTQDDAMPAEQRHIDEMKIFSGSIISGAGALAANALAVAGGIIPLAEALYDIESSGHKWRVQHHQIPS